MIDIKNFKSIYLLNIFIRICPGRNFWNAKTCITIRIHQKKSHKNRSLIKKVIKVLKLEIFTIIYIGKRK